MDTNTAVESQGVISSTSDGGKLTFSEVECVTKSWIVDFYFLSLCRYYKEKNVAKFSKTLRAFEVIVDDDCHLQDVQQTKRTICCFLSRITDGKNLDVHYDPNSSITPLMSALQVWECLKTAVADTSLHDNVRVLLFVQSVGVCLEMGKVQLAAETLKWLETETDLPQKLQRKLSTVLNKKDAHDQLLMSFSYNRLIESVSTFLDMFLEEYPSDFLLKAASQVVQVRQERSEREESTPTSHTSEISAKPKKKLFSTRSIHPWKPETAKKSLCVPRKTSRLKVSRLSFKDEQGLASLPSDKQGLASLQHRGKRMWTWEEDRHLRAGVKAYGEGKWAKILEQFEFPERTSVMLKDRWRTLKKNGKDF
ncbi:telomeric repeat-binding factor 1 isoform X2 [Electrophorus electricus]|uniref:telomeric repeat-binding factor 1 isoform X2 n=1 Tax=Electrophorus electricus TaxID=8005 RepID=UPI0015CF935C|nr:telomeric repeat-binding factor 1 isoform X2 [Electrophorus electricus]